MTKDEALRIALETLEYAGPSWIDARQPAITAIKEALAQPEQDWIERERAVGYREGHRAALAQRTWVGLTDEDISEIVRGTHNTGSFVRAIEAKLKAKNT